MVEISFTHQRSSLSGTTEVEGEQSSPDRVFRGEDDLS